MLRIRALALAAAIILSSAAPVGAHMNKDCVKALVEYSTIAAEHFSKLAAMETAGEFMLKGKPGGQRLLDQTRVKFKQEATDAILRQTERVAKHCIEEQGLP